MQVGQSLSAPLDRAVILFTIGVTGAVAVLFGLAPAFASTRIDVAPVLKDGEASKRTDKLLHDQREPTSPRLAH